MRFAGGSGLFDVCEFLVVIYFVQLICFGLLLVRVWVGFYVGVILFVYGYGLPYVSWLIWFFLVVVFVLRVLGCWLATCSLVVFWFCGCFGDLAMVCGVFGGCLRAFGLAACGGVLGSGACWCWFCLFGCLVGCGFGY